MKKLLPLALVTLALTSCDKEEKIAEPLTIEHVTINQSFKHYAPIHLDVNNDGKTDFAFSNVLYSDERGAHTLFYVRPLEGNEVLLDTQPTNLHIGLWHAGLQEGETVLENSAANQQWASGLVYLMDIRKDSDTFTFYEGPAANETTPYIAVRIKDGENYKLGWFKLKYDLGDEKLHVVEAAFAKAGIVLKTGQRK